MDNSKKIITDLICTSSLFLLLLIVSFFFNKSEGKAELINHILLCFSLTAVVCFVIKILVHKLLSSKVENDIIFIVYIVLNIVAVAIAFVISRPYVKDISAEHVVRTVPVSECTLSKKYIYKTIKYYIMINDSDEKFVISNSHYNNFSNYTQNGSQDHKSFTIEYYPSSKIVYDVTAN